jgi:hypothetical protein
MSNPRIVYTTRPEIVPEMELSALANVYKFVLDCRANRNAAGVTSTNGDDAKERSRSDSSARRTIP